MLVSPVFASIDSGNTCSPFNHFLNRTSARDQSPQRCCRSTHHPDRHPFPTRLCHLTSLPPRPLYGHHPRLTSASAHVLTCFRHLPAEIPSSESPPPHTKPPSPTAWQRPSSLTGSDAPYPSALADACLIPSRLHAAWNYPAMQMPCLLTPSILTPYS